jgi:hypothetical protein
MPKASGLQLVQLAVGVLFLLTSWSKKRVSIPKEHIDTRIAGRTNAQPRLHQQAREIQRSSFKTEERS